MNIELLTELLLSPAALALLALLAERWFPWPEQWHPLAVFRLMASYLSSKVNRPGRSVSQQRLAGFLAWLTLSLLVLVPAAIVFAGAELSVAVGWLILLVSLRQQPVSQAVRLADHHLQHGRKNAARAWLSRISWRDCELLSEHGIAKTSLELRASSILEHRSTPLLFWFFGGPLAALGVRTLSELIQVWPVAQTRYRHFGVTTHWFYTISHFIPSFLLSLAARFMALFQRNKPKLHSLNRNLLFPTVLLSWLQSFSYCHRVSLGGPIQVQGVRIARQRFDARPPELLLPRALRWQRQWQIFFICCLVIALFAPFIYRP